MQPSARHCLALLLSAAALSPGAQAQIASDLIISEYVEGSGNNKGLEFFNGTDATVDLAGGGYVLQMYFNGNVNAGVNVALSGFVAPGETFVLAQANAAAEVLNIANQTSAASWFNGDDALVLRRGGTTGPILDVIGQVGTDPGSQWGSGLTSTADNTLRRQGGITAGDTNPADAFDPALQWTGFASNTFDGLGVHADGGDNDPGGDPGDGGGEPSVCGAAFTPTYAIQGSGSAAAITGTVTTEGIVTADFEGPSPALRGFYVQDAEGDGDPATSDGLFVFNGTLDNVILGQRVRVTGVAGEFQDQTQISQVSQVSQVSQITVCASGQTVTPVEISLPLSDADFLEQFEGMLVTMPQTLHVTEHFQLGRFGQVVLSSGERLFQPTSVARPGAEALAQQASNDLNRIILDDARNEQNPDPIVFGRGGDTVTGLTGVMTYTWAGNAASGNAFRVRPLNVLGGAVPQFVPANPRPATVPAVDGRLRVASFNVLNYFNTFDGCSFGVDGPVADCRGADDFAEFERQAAKIVAAILGLNAHVVGLMEIENDGYDTDSAIDDLVWRLNEATAPGTWAFVDADVATGQVNALGTDAIKVGLLYRPDTVTPEGTAALNDGAFGEYELSNGQRIGRNRPVLAQTFREKDGGASVTVAVNHLKSKGSPCDNNVAPVISDPDLGDGQGNCNRTREAAAHAMADWLATDPTGAGHLQQLVIGDLNAYAKEDPIGRLEDAGFVNLLSAFLGERTYGYVFDGQWGYLDHALASPTLVSQVAGITEWHINADEPTALDYNTNFKSPGQQVSLYAADAFRSSDHDPVLVGLNLDATPPQLQLQASSSVLFPPNHRYVDVRIDVRVTDSLDPAPQVALVSATSSEADDTRGNGRFINDVIVVDDRHVRLRAERANAREGRVYTLVYRATDFAGNETLEEVTVRVPGAGD